MSDILIDLRPVWDELIDEYRDELLEALRRDREADERERQSSQSEETA